MSGARLRADGVSKAFDGTTVLDAVDLDVAASEIVALTGPSGSGKSTLLRILAGLEVADAGRVWLDDRDVTAVPTHRRGIGMVFQDEQLFEHLDVAGNIAYGLKLAKLPAEQRRRRVAELLDLVGLAGFERRQVTDLSGGEAKRVALARSLAPAPRVLLLDEPLAALDRDLHDRLAGDLAAILRAERITAVLVTHDLDEARTIADRVVGLSSL